ncbi:hypothetical protein K7X08_022309 [Anisodus acutangulus]|uniref:AB hydrolase-1 domain-containing protein n=1 Tax=Anisodus acutangulus TaxID=402998 RepID=A0A9Q1MIT4_9SOLA|nr:hypothetical protein K7X08_022309 [Anisodus acutangulus]
MEEHCFEHKTVKVNGVNMHVVEKGQGPIVLFIHGFPEFWYSWRHQISFMAKHGYRAVGPDLRGYGDTTGGAVFRPNDITNHSICPSGQVKAVHSMLFECILTCQYPYLQSNLLKMFLPCILFTNSALSGNL